MKTQNNVEQAIGRAYLRQMIMIEWRAMGLDGNLTDKQIVDMADSAANTVCVDVNVSAPDGRS